MENFWSIISGWDNFWQFIFFLIVLGGFAKIIRRIAYYISVAIRGWPPEHLNQEIEEEDG